MNEIDWKSKLSSRKFWALVATFIVAVVTLITGQDPTVTISACVMAFGAIVAYILGESWVDAANASSKTTNITGELSQAEAKKLVQ